MGLGFGYRESVELTLVRLSTLIELDTGYILHFLDAYASLGSTLSLSH